MPAESKKQQRFFGMVHAVQKGELSPSEVGPAVRKAAKNASTKHKNLPEKIGSVQMKYFEKISSNALPSDKWNIANDKKIAAKAAKVVGGRPIDSLERARGLNMHGVKGPYKVVKGSPVALSKSEITKLRTTKTTEQLKTWGIHDQPAKGARAKQTLSAASGGYNPVAGAAKESKAAKIMSSLKKYPRTSITAGVGAAGLFAGGYMLGKK